MLILLQQNFFGSQLKSTQNILLRSFVITFSSFNTFLASKKLQQLLFLIGTVTIEK